MTHSVTQKDTLFYLAHSGFVTDKYEAVWIDQQNDDLGDGDYTYPTDTLPGGTPRFTKGEADLLEFRFTEGATSTDTFLYFLIIVEDTFNGGEDWPSFIAYFTIDTAQTLQNSKYAPQYSDVQIFGNWAYSGVFSMYGARLLNANYRDTNSAGHLYASQNNVYEAALKIDSLGLYHRGYHVSLGVGLEALGDFREVDSIESQYNGGGGISDWADPDVYDLAFIKSADQVSELSGYSAGNPVTITNAIKYVMLYVDVKEKPVFKSPKLLKPSAIYDVTGRKIMFIKKRGIYIKSDKKIIKIK